MKDVLRERGLFLFALVEVTNGYRVVCITIVPALEWKSAGKKKRVVEPVQMSKKSDETVLWIVLEAMMDEKTDENNC